MRIYDTSKREMVDFKPSDPEDIRIYACGPTVYDRIHLGNARSSVVFDLLRRVLVEEYGDVVTYAQNITDVDDKINARARELGVEIGELTEETSAWFNQDVSELGVMTPDIQPRATDSISAIIRSISDIMTNGHAYVSTGEDGQKHVFFDVASDPDSGKLFRAGMTGIVPEGEPSFGMRKRNPSDFVLWKPSAPDQPSWPSPWGDGRPGWHIECSAMISEAFGERGVDIHAGGSDLQFPHHENEAAQHRCSHPGHQIAKHWMHNGMITVNGQKMSKSLGNFTTVRDVLDRGYGGDAIRLSLLSSHYGNSLDWSDELLNASRSTIRKWKEVAEGAKPEVDEDIRGHLMNDLMTPMVIARMHELHKAGDFGKLSYGMSLMGLDEASPEPELTISPETMERLHEIISERASAREGKNWALSDELRDEAREIGFTLRDKGDITEWEYVGVPADDPSPEP